MPSLTAEDQAILDRLGIVAHARYRIADRCAAAVARSYLGNRASPMVRSVVAYERFGEQLRAAAARRRCRSLLTKLTELIPRFA